MPQEAEFSVGGVRILPGCLGPAEQTQMLADLRDVVAAAPLFAPVTRFGPMSVRMTAAGAFGWVADARGYRYERTHPVTGMPWPPIPRSVLKIWHSVAPTARAPECCLVNFYSGNAKMGLHQDHDEADFSQPVVSISLGDEGRFRVGGTSRGGRTESTWLRSGDVAILAGPARLAYHGIDRIAPGTSTLLKDGGRINLTLRVVT